MVNRQNNNNKPPISYGKIKFGTKTINDSIFEVGSFKRANPRLSDPDAIIRAINDNDLNFMREVSDFFYRTSGIYNRIIRYLAFMYRYDWFLVPHVHSSNKGKKMKDDELKDIYHDALDRLESFQAKKVFGEIALKVLIQGVYYGYKVKSGNSYTLQELPAKYCRHMWDSGNKPVVEFNMAFFNETFKNEETRKAVLNSFPPEFKKGYDLYIKGKLAGTELTGLVEGGGSRAGWFTLDCNNTVRFTMNGREYPNFITSIPLIINLDEAQDLDKQRTKQRILKLIVQKLPLDKNGEMLFDPEEGQAAHDNAVHMLNGMPGAEVLTTFSEVSVESLSDSSVASSQSDDLSRFERQVFNDTGTPQTIFNTEGAAALEKSILNDEATMYNLMLQFQQFLNDLISDFNKNPKKFHLSVSLLNTTIYNYEKLSKLYKEQMQVGYSKFLSQVALGQSQSDILASAYFENEILDLVNVFIPPMMSSTMNVDVLNRNKAESNKIDKAAGIGDKGGRPTKESQGESVSEKTVQNIESQK